MSNDLQKIKPVGEILPQNNIYEQIIKDASNEKSTEKTLKKEGIDPKNIILGKRKTIKRKLY
jgi:hypothetical protein